MPKQGGNESSARLDRELAQRLHQALSAGREELYQVLQDPSPEVVRTALKNRNLGKDHLLALLKRRDLPDDLPKAIHRIERFRTSHRLQLALARNIATPGPVVLSLLPHLYLFELLDLCILPGTTPDQRCAAERQIVQRLPTTALGNKIALARRAPGGLLGYLLKEGEPQIVQACLENPRLREVDVVQFLGGPKPTAETISMIARHPRWKNRPNAKLSLLKNRNTPAIWFTVFLPQLRTAEINALLASRRLSTAQKKQVQDELKRRGA